MPEYGSAEYWNIRYKDEAEPFDWLFDFSDVKDILESLIPEKDSRMLLVGSGNAPFSPDLYHKGNYKNIINIDLSDVVIEQQQKNFPGQEWLVMDAMDMSFEDGHFPYIIDKSLIDTIMCSENGAEKCKTFVDESYRVLAPGGRFITFSLHGPGEVHKKYSADCNPHLEWRTSAYRIQSHRWDENKHRHRAVAHTMIVCDKPLADGSYLAQHPLSIEGVLSDEDYQKLQARADEVNLRHALKAGSTTQLQTTLYGAILSIARSKSSSSTSATEALNEAEPADVFHGIDPSFAAEVEDVEQLKRYIRAANASVNASMKAVKEIDATVATNIDVAYDVDGTEGTANGIDRSDAPASKGIPFPAVGCSSNPAPASEPLLDEAEPDRTGTGNGDAVAVTKKDIARLKQFIRAAAAARDASVNINSTEASVADAADCPGAAATVVNESRARKSKATAAAVIGLKGNSGARAGAAGTAVVGPSSHQQQARNMQTSGRAA